MMLTVQGRRLCAQEQDPAQERTQGPVEDLHFTRNLETFRVTPEAPVTPSAVRDTTHFPSLYDDGMLKMIAELEKQLKAQGCWTSIARDKLEVIRAQVEGADTGAVDEAKQSMAQLVREHALSFNLRQYTTATPSVHIPVKIAKKLVRKEEVTLLLGETVGETDAGKPTAAHYSPGSQFERTETREHAPFLADEQLQVEEKEPAPTPTMAAKPVASGTNPISGKPPSFEDLYDKSGNESDAEDSRNDGNNEADKTAGQKFGGFWCVLPGSRLCQPRRRHSHELAAHARKPEVAHAWYGA